MELKEWREYVEEEKKELLIHWFQNYGRLTCSNEEFEEFKRLIEMDADLMFDVAVGAFSNGRGTQAFLVGMRSNTLASFLNSILEMRCRAGYKDWFNKIGSDLLSNLIRTINNLELIERVFFDADLEKQTKNIVNMKVGKF